MGHKILICGGNGAGKSTLARALAKASGYKWMDTEDYFFPNSGNGYAYEQPRKKEEVAALLLADLKRYENFIFTSVVADFGDEALSRFTQAVLVSVPKALRMRRVRERSFQKFGGRMLPGGDLYEQEEGFFRMVEARPQEQAETWLESLSLPAIRVDGTKPPEENAGYILRALAKEGAGRRRENPESRASG